MKLKFPAFTVSFLLPFLVILAQPLSAKTNPEALALKAVSENSTKAAPAIAELRAMGPTGLQALFHAHADEINEQISNPMIAASPEWQRLSAALDQVSQQKDSYLSGLYWYTDLDQAKAAAKASGKPILSLRLLGKLSEEFSCANSRFFRTILYSNAAVSQLLRERFILHWQSERPAPRVTIDFGDGRKLERTLTGNSIHYVLDSDGRVIDALPGLYGPAAFMRLMARAEAASKDWAKQPPADGSRQPFWAYHPDSLRMITLDWTIDTQKIGGKVPQGFVIMKDGNGNPQALEIAERAITKMISEVDLLKGMTAGSQALGRVTDEAAWNKIAALHLTDAKLDQRSIGLIKRQMQKAITTTGSGNSGEALDKLVQKLQAKIAMDTVRNEYLLHTKLYSWFVADKNRFERIDLEGLNKRVYAELFQTPATDPWLGLFSPEVYTALEGGGVKSSR